MNQFNKSSQPCTFSRNERLKSVKDIQELFSKSSSFYLFPFLIKYNGELQEGELPKMLISVPKKKFKRAVDRNAIKRRVREAYRLSKPKVFGTQKSLPKNIVIIYLGKEVLPFDFIKNKLTLAITRLSNS